MRQRVLAFALLYLTATVTHAALIDMRFINSRWYQDATGRPDDISTSTATWQYDTVTSTLIQTGGTFALTMKLTPTTIVWTHVITDLHLGSFSASASSFDCIEGNEGASENRNWCGGYSFGDNFIDESTATWGPGVAYQRTIGGDDVADSGQWSIFSWAVYSTVSWDGFTLRMGSHSCLTTCGSNGNFGRMFTLEAVPAPAAGWFVAPALGLLAPWLRRRTPA